METIKYKKTQETAQKSCPTRSVHYWTSGSKKSFRNSIFPYEVERVGAVRSTIEVISNEKAQNNLILLYKRFHNSLEIMKQEDRKSANDTFLSTLESLKSVRIDSFNLEITQEKSLLFSLIKDDFSIYLENYIDDNEVIITLYKNKVKQKSISGNLKYSIHKLNEEIK